MYYAMLSRQDEVTINNIDKQLEEIRITNLGLYDKINNLGSCIKQLYPESVRAEYLQKNIISHY